MIRQFTLRSWEECEECLEMLDKFLEERRNEWSTDGVVTDPVVYRGHADSGWRLESTLDRSSLSKDLHQYLSEIRDLINDRTKEVFGIEKNLPEPDVDVLIRKCFEYSPYVVFNKDFCFLGEPPQVKAWLVWMANLRHHGYPSPLLDWTYSRDVAAHFAFSGSEGSGYVSIYAHVGDAGRGMVSPNESMSRVTLDASDFPVRHKNQKSVYTLSLKRIVTSENWSFSFVSPEEVAMNAWRNSYESSGFFADPYDSLAPFDRPPLDNLIWRFDVPKSEKGKVLKVLASRGVTTESLMGESKDAYVKDLLLLKN